MKTFSPLLLLLLLTACPPDRDPGEETPADDDDSSSDDDDSSNDDDDSSNDDDDSSNDDDDSSNDDDDSSNDDDDSSDDDDDTPAEVCDEGDQFVPDFDAYYWSSEWQPVTLLQWPPASGPEIELIDDPDDDVMDFWNGEEDAGEHVWNQDLAAGDELLLLRGSSNYESGWEGRGGLADADGELLMQFNYDPGGGPYPAWSVTTGADMDCEPDINPWVLEKVGGTVVQTTVVFSRGADSVELEPGEAVEAFGFRFAVEKSLRYSGGFYDKFNTSPTWTLITRLPE